MVRKIVIGSASFGTKYGLINDSAIDRADVAKILSHGLSEGIRTIDTASSYRGSERVIGNCKLAEWEVISKIRKKPINLRKEEITNWAINEVVSSLKRLRKKSLYGLLLHHPEDLISRDGDQYIKALCEIKKEGLVKKIGFSIYQSEQLDILTGSFWPDIVQAPINAFDKRIVDSGWIERLVKSGSEIHARSVFLQGLLLSKDLRKHEYFKKWNKQFDSWHVHLERNGILPLEGALLAVANISSVTKIVVGVNSFQQFCEIIEACKSLAKRGVAIDSSALKCTEEDLIDPRQWYLGEG